MKFLQIDDPSDTLPISYRLMQLFGLGRDEQFKCLYWFQCIMFFLFSIVTRLIMEAEDTVTIVRLGSERVYAISLFSHILGLYVRRSRLYELMDSLRECTAKTHSEEIFSFFLRTNRTINNFSVLYCRYFIGMFILYETMPSVATFFVYFSNKRNLNATPEEYVIPTEMNFYNLDIRYNLLHYSIYFAVVSMLVVTSSVSLCTKGVVDFSAIKFTAMIFEMTAMQIRQLPRQISQPQLLSIIESHQATLRCSKKLQQALSLSLLFQLAFCSAMGCLMLFYILLMGFDSRIFNLALLLFIVTLETYAYCTLGTQLTEKSDEVLQALQSLAWYEQPVAIQKQLLVMIQRSQMPTVLTAGKLIPVNIAQFGAMVQKSYSFYLVLKDLF
ncbi:uncharacterized protein LOC126569637 [Anopheles aquasalis]|uniref:uncharacterized protein LOC126569637 n=1 Tax=Anopheles aquasalis TaxID=42839 RepID=UPI00215A162D|nr:uncharacterized protein LOC126569637 [Anopheles aquasalis]